MDLWLFLIILLSFYNQNFIFIFWLAFIIGLSKDLINGSFLGYTSLFFLGVSFFIYLYRWRFRVSNLIYQLSFIVMVDGISKFINHESWSWPKLLALALFSLLVLLLVAKIKKKTTSGLRLEL